MITRKLAQALSCFTPEPSVITGVSSVVANGVKQSREQGSEPLDCSAIARKDGSYLHAAIVSSSRTLVVSPSNHIPT